MKDKILFIFNPVSGQSQIRNYLVDILGILSTDDNEIICYPTKKHGDASRIVRERTDDYKYVVCAGGDGTLDEVVNGMMESPDKPFVPIGYIPCGTTNDFAASLGIPTDMVSAAKTVKDGNIVNCDLGMFIGGKEEKRKEYFVYVAAFGIFTGTSYDTPQDLKNMFGHLAYIMQGVQELGNLQTFHVHAETDQLTVSDEFAFGMISNSKSVGGFPNPAGDSVNLSDGIFEVLLVKMPRNLIEINDIIQFMSQGSDYSELVYRFRTSKIVIESEEKIRWTLDGEYGGAFKRVSMQNLRQKLQIIVPSDVKL